MLTRATAVAAAASAIALMATGSVAPAAASPVGPPGLADDSGTRLVWSRFTDDFSAMHLMTARADGSDLRPLTEPIAGVNDVDADISPDGRRVVFERDREDRVELVVIDIDGSDERVLDLGCVSPCFGDVAPTWAPDGERIWFTRAIGPVDERGAAASAVLWSASIDGGAVRRESPAGIEPEYEDYAATFAPTGERVFLRLRNDDGRSVVMVTDADDEERRITEWDIDADMIDVSPATSGPTAGLVVFETFGHGAPEGETQAVGTVPLRCPSPTACEGRIRFLTPTEPLPAAPAENFNPTWSPDGTRIGYTAVRWTEDALLGDIRTMRWDGSDDRRFTDTAEFDFRPDWGVDRTVD